MKKNILPKIITLGVIATPIIIGTSLISTSNISTNESSEKITTKVVNSPSPKASFGSGDALQLTIAKIREAEANGGV
jgi:hypothetical protein